MQKVIPGIDIFLQRSELFKNHRLGLVTNNAAFTSEHLLSRLALLTNGFNLVKIFSPEHGISVKGEDGVYQNHSTDVKTDLPVISLYGDRLMPTEEDLTGTDVILFDIPDVGCRFYTYLWTMTYVMEACARYNKQLIVLDRPNPIGGDLSKAEGPMLDEVNCTSFIGRWSIPIRHSCTLGELANYFSAKKVNGCDLKIIAAQNWKRDKIAGTDGFDFYPTSPAIQNISTALVYPGMGLLEGINLNEGRGTAHPFMQFGAPWINAEEVKTTIIQKDLPGIDIKSGSYIPTDSLYKNEKCNGLELKITDREKFCPVSFGIDLIAALFKLYPNQVKERAYVTNANPSGNGHLDKLLGIKSASDLFKQKIAIKTKVAGAWALEVGPYLLYN